MVKYSKQAFITGSQILSVTTAQSTFIMDVAKSSNDGNLLKSFGVMVGQTAKESPLTHEGRENRTNGKKSTKLQENIDKDFPNRQI
jgi:hypothetical protein